MNPRREREVVRIGGRIVDLTRTGKVLFPNDGITKRELFDYYQRIAATMLRYLRGRPVVMERYPDGIHGQKIFQRTPPLTFLTGLKSLPCPKRWRRPSCGL